MINLLKWITLLATLTLSTLYAENNTTKTDDAMKKIDNIEDDILSSLEADAKKETNKTDKNKKNK